MTRGIDPAAELALAQPVVRVALLSEMEFATGTARTFTGLGTLAWNGVPFTGTGDLLQLSAVEETAEVRSVKVTWTLSGVPVDIIQLAEQDGWQNRPARIWLAVFEDDGVTLQGEPVLLHRGRMDQLSYTEGADATLQLTSESRLADLERARIRRYTSGDQQADYPDDLGFSHVETTAEGVEVDW